MKRSEVVKLVALLSVAYKDDAGRPIIDSDDATVSLWGRVLEDVTATDAQAALDAWLRDEDRCRFVPQPGQLRGLALREHVPEQTRPPEPPNTITVYNRFNPETGGYDHLPVPVVMDRADFLAMQHEQTAAYHRLHPEILEQAKARNAAYEERMAAARRRGADE